MTAETQAQLPDRRVFAVPYRKAGTTLTGYQCRIVTPTTVRTFDPIFDTEAEAIAYAEGRQP